MAANDLEEAVQLRFQAFAKCSQCLAIFKTAGSLAHIMLSNPAPCCGGTGEARIIWPDTALFLALPDLLGDSEPELRQKATSLCSAVEAGLRDILIEVLGAMNTPPTVDGWRHIHSPSSTPDLSNSLLDKSPSESADARHPITRSPPGMSHRQHFDRFVSEQSKQHDVWEASKAGMTYDGRTQQLRECSRPFRDAGDRGVQRSQKLLSKLRLALGVKARASRTSRAASGRKRTFTWP